MRVVQQRLRWTLACVLCLALAGCDKECGGTEPTEVADRLAVDCAATPTSGRVPLTVQFTATSRGGNGGVVVMHGWTFGDGGSLGTGAGTHTYVAIGSFTATVTVSQDGVRRSCSVTIQVRPD